MGELTCTDGPDPHASYKTDKWYREVSRTYVVAIKDEQDTETKITVSRVPGIESWSWGRHFELRPKYAAANGLCRSKTGQEGWRTRR